VDRKLRAIVPEGSCTFLRALLIITVHHSPVFRVLTEYITVLCKCGELGRTRWWYETEKDWALGIAVEEARRINFFTTFLYLWALLALDAECGKGFG
jgi:hypothetical protein